MGARASGGTGTVPAVFAAVGLAVSIVAAGVGVFALVQVRGHEREARLLDANLIAHDLASKIAACSDPDRSDLPGRARRKLPPLSRKVPANMADARGFRGTASDWDDEAFRCAQFHPLVALDVQIQWMRSQSSDDYDQVGEVWAAIDLDDDGTADKIAVTEVGCSAKQCTVAPQFGPELER